MPKKTKKAANKPQASAAKKASARPKPAARKPAKAAKPAPKAKAARTKAALPKLADKPKKVAKARVPKLVDKAKKATKAAPQKSKSASTHTADTVAAVGRIAKRAVAQLVNKMIGKATSEISEGSQAPSFDLSDDSGTKHSARSLSGKPYVLYFYPKADTPGCTKQACDFRDSLTRFNSSDVQVIGVSPDATQANGKFRKKHGLTFPLLSDTEKTLANAYGVWVKKHNYGREYMGIERSTFLVGADGIVRKVWRGVRVPGHVDAVLAAAKDL